MLHLIHSFHSFIHLNEYSGMDKAKDIFKGIGAMYIK